MDEKSCKTIFSSEKMDWGTPQALFDKLNAEFCFTVDAAALPSNAKCSRFWSPEEDGLRQNWGGVKKYFVTLHTGETAGDGLKKPTLNPKILALLW